MRALYRFTALGLIGTAIVGWVWGVAAAWFALCLVGIVSVGGLLTLLSDAIERSEALERDLARVRRHYGGRR